MFKRRLVSVFALGLLLLLALAALRNATAHASDRPSGPAAAQSIPLVSSGDCPRFLDDLSDSAGNWRSGDAVTAMLLAAPTCDAQDPPDAVDAYWVGPPGEFYALVFGLEGEFDRYRLRAVRPGNDVYLVLEFRDGQFETLRDPAFSDAIRSESLAVTALGGQTSDAAYDGP